MHGVAPLRPNMKMAGPAFTLRYIPMREDLDPGTVDNLKDVQRIGIEQIGEGEVLVIDARGDTPRRNDGVNPSNTSPLPWRGGHCNRWCLP